MVKKIKIIVLNVNDYSGFQQNEFSPAFIRKLISVLSLRFAGLINELFIR